MFKEMDQREYLRILLNLDMDREANRKVQGANHPDDHCTVSWIREYGKGRVFYCSLGHHAEVFRTPADLAPGEDPAARSGRTWRGG